MLVACHPEAVHPEAPRRPGSDPARVALTIDDVARRVLAAVPTTTRALIAVDGVGASGKTSFARALARRITTRPVVLLHADDFLQPPAVRYARGRYSPEGFWRDAFDTPALRATLDHLAAAGDGRYRTSSGDPSDATGSGPSTAPVDALVLVEGVFLHRDELVDRWDLSVWLDVPPGEAARRMVARDGLAPDDPRLERYAGAQRLYAAAARPWERAAMVIDVSDPAAMRVVDRPGPA